MGPIAGRTREGLSGQPRKYEVTLQGGTIGDAPPPHQLLKSFIIFSPLTINFFKRNYSRHAFLSSLASPGTILETFNL